MTAPRPTVDELEARVRDLLDNCYEAIKLPENDRRSSYAALSDLAARAREAEVKLEDVEARIADARLALSDEDIVDALEYLSESTP